MKRNKEKTMKMPTREQIRKASEQCPDAKETLRELFPEAFESEWEDVTFKNTRLNLRGTSKKIGAMTDGEDFYMPYIVTFEDAWKGDRENSHPVTNIFVYKLVNNRIYRKKRGF